MNRIFGCFGLLRVESGSLIHSDETPLLIKNSLSMAFGSADPAKTVNCYLCCHFAFLLILIRKNAVFTVLSPSLDTTTG